MGRGGGEGVTLCYVFQAFACGGGEGELKVERFLSLSYYNKVSNHNIPVSVFFPILYKWTLGTSACSFKNPKPYAQECLKHTHLK